LTQSASRLRFNSGSTYDFEIQSHVYIGRGSLKGW
jgi:hypothetical protein